MTTYYHSRSQVKKIPMSIPFNADEVFVHFFSWLLGSAVRSSRDPPAGRSEPSISRSFIFRTKTSTDGTPSKPSQARFHWPKPPSHGAETFHFSGRKKMRISHGTHSVWPCKRRILPRSPSRQIHADNHAGNTASHNGTATLEQLLRLFPKYPYRRALKADGTVALPDPVPEGVNLR